MFRTDQETQMGKFRQQYWGRIHRSTVFPVMLQRFSRASMWTKVKLYLDSLIRLSNMLWAEVKASLCCFTALWCNRLLFTWKEKKKTRLQTKLFYLLLFFNICCQGMYTHTLFLFTCPPSLVKPSCWCSVWWQSSAAWSGLIYWKCFCSLCIYCSWKFGVFSTIYSFKLGLGTGRWWRTVPDLHLKTLSKL